MRKAFNIILNNSDHISEKLVKRFRRPDSNKTCVICQAISYHTCILRKKRLCSGDILKDSVTENSYVSLKQTGSATVLQINAVLNIGMNGNRFENLELSAVPFRAQSFPQGDPTSRIQMMQNSGRSRQFSVCGSLVGSLHGKGLNYVHVRIRIYTSKIDLSDIIPDVFTLFCQRHQWFTLNSARLRRDWFPGI